MAGDDGAHGASSSSLRRRFASHERIIITAAAMAKERIVVAAAALFDGHMRATSWQRLLATSARLFVRVQSCSMHAAPLAQQEGEEKTLDGGGGPLFCPPPGPPSPEGKRCRTLTKKVTAKSWNP